MARVTVEDCLKSVENRFDLVIKAAERAHMLELGEADPQVSADNDKPTVIALREIAEGYDITKTRAMLDTEAETAVSSERISELEVSALLSDVDVPDEKSPFLPGENPSSKKEE